jgi:hypothetical protein
MMASVMARPDNWINFVKQALGGGGDQRLAIERAAIVDEDQTIAFVSEELAGKVCEIDGEAATFQDRLKIAERLDVAGAFAPADIPIVIVMLEMFGVALGHGSLLELLVFAAMDGAAGKPGDRRRILTSFEL